MKVGVWCAVSARRIVEPVFFNETIEKNIYMKSGQHFQYLLGSLNCNSFQTLLASGMLIHGQNSYTPRSKQHTGHREAQSHEPGPHTQNPPCM
jgi:hypothetical protein